MVAYVSSLSSFPEFPQEALSKHATLHCLPVCLSPYVPPQSAIYNVYNVTCFSYVHRLIWPLLWSM